MKVGLIDVDGHNFPNLALMKISAYHKSIGDTVEWWWGWDHYDKVYMSKVFDETYSEDMPDPANADVVVRGGTGYGLDNKVRSHSVDFFDVGVTLGIETLEGLMQASVGDYIIKGVNGEFYPCKPDIFEKTYERVEGDG